MKTVTELVLLTCMYSLCSYVYSFVCILQYVSLLLKNDDDDDDDDDDLTQNTDLRHSRKSHPSKAFRSEWVYANKTCQNTRQREPLQSSAPKHWQITVTAVLITLKTTPIKCEDSTVKYKQLSYRRGTARRLVIRTLKGRCYGNQFLGKISEISLYTRLYSSSWHSNADCYVAILIFKNSSGMNWLHYV